MRCTATASYSGKRCGMDAPAGADVCHRHKPKDDAEHAAASLDALARQREQDAAGRAEREQAYRAVAETNNRIEGAHGRSRRPVSVIESGGDR